MHKATVITPWEMVKIRATVPARAMIFKGVKFPVGATLPKSNGVTRRRGAPKFEKIHVK